MSIDNEILQEFLVEAGELYEQLNDQFVELEQSPDDGELINAIFRAYHTIKGGAGFMKLTPMVEICHRAEDAINLVRQGERQVDADMIDVMFQALDELEVMFDAVRGGGDLDDASPELLQRLDGILGRGGDAAPAEPAAVEAETPAAPADEAAIAEPPSSQVDAEFDAMLAQSGDEAGETAAAGDSELITDQEFEQLMDEMHGKGRGPGSAAEPVDARPPDNDIITDDEFEQLMDELHGKGMGPGSAAAPAPAPAATGGGDRADRWDR